MVFGELAQPLINGLLAGLIYILMALGLTLIFSIMNVLNFAHGEVYMFGAFCVFYLCTLLHINYGLALVIAMAATGVFGLLLERVFRPVRDDMLASVILAIGLSWFLQNFAQLMFGRQPRAMAEAFPGTLSFLTITIGQSRLMAGLTSIVLLALVYVFVYKTKPGKAMQAMAQDREAAALQGVDINRIGPLGFFLGCVLAGAAGGIMAPILYIDALMGGTVLLKALCIIILGGVGSIPGAALGGLILGVVESYGQTFLGYASSTFPFLIMILILLFKRTGLMGRKA